MSIRSPIVPPYGPKDALVAWVGESPGQEECKANRPWVGVSGQMVRRGLGGVGIDPNGVWWTNACRQMVYPWPSGKTGASHLLHWAPMLDDELAQLTGVKVIVACGTVALQRLTGLTDMGSHWGSVLRQNDVPDVLGWPGCEWPRKWPLEAVVIPCWHPSGILRDPQRLSLPEFDRTLKKVAAILNGTLKGVEFEGRYYPSVEELKTAYMGT